MKDLLRGLKYQPWRSLLQVSGLTILIVIFLELLLSEVYTQLPRIYSVLSALYQPPLGKVVLLAQAVGVGALAVYLLDRFFPRVFINLGSLWALVPCLALVIFLKSLLPVPGLVITGLNYLQFIGIIVGVFWKGRPYW